MPSAPTLTQEWAAAYLQILFGLFVFSIGIPALITQVIAQEDVRYFAYRMQKKTWLISCVLIFAVSLLFVWWLHPSNNEELSAKRSLIAAVIVTLTSCLVIFFSPISRGFGRETIIRNFRKNLFKSLKKENSLDERIIDDLKYLGENGDPGQEKELVLQVISDLVDHLKTSNQYTGDQLDRLIHSIPAILTYRKKPGNDGNFEMAARILRKIRHDLPKDEMPSTTDQITAISMIKSLGTEAVIMGLEKAPFAFLELTESGFEDLAFEIGLSALRNGRFRLAVAALRKLETLNENGETISNNEVTAYQIGLLAHFSVSGISSCQHAERTLSEISTYCSPSLKDCLDFAFDYHCENLRFDTADCVAVLRHAIGNDVQDLHQRIFPDDQISRSILRKER